MARDLYSQVGIGVPRDEAALVDDEMLRQFTILANSFVCFTS